MTESPGRGEERGGFGPRRDGGSTDREQRSKAGNQEESEWEV